CALLLGDTGPVHAARMVDARLARGDTDGWHHEGMPEEGAAWKRSLGALNLVGRSRHGRAFVLLLRDEQEEIIREVQDRADADEADEVDLVVVGAGAGGSVLTQRLARAGWSVVVFDAGPFWDPDRDWVSDEAGSHHLFWTEPRQVGGTDPVALGSNNSGRGV